MAAAEASFRISIDAMSFGLMKLRGLPPGIPPRAFPRPGRALPPSRGTPSTTKSGWLLERIDALPRTLTVVAPPGAPELLTTWTPATLPWINWSAPVSTPLLKSLAFTCATAPVRSFLRAEPYPTTTTSLRLDPDAARTMFMLSVMFTSTVPKPTEETTSTLALAGTLSWKVPSAAEDVPVVVPLAATDAPETGAPSLPSVTLPDTVLFCATATWNAKSIATGSSMALSKRFGFINSGFKN